MFVGRVTSLNLWDVSFNDSEIRSLPRCVNDQRGNVIAWRQFQKLEGPFLISATKCDDIDNCASTPCENEETCLDGQDMFTCSCMKAYTGDRCDVNIDDCVGNSCQNGATCIDEEESYTCECRFEFTGAFCETTIVDGGWTTWGIWGPCSVTCDSGHQVRVRDCSDPEPENGGAN
ncbi:hypothetical protein DPMN_144623 [Dreissena polymorpha]|uniref:Uncharacterized protein n=1 Tax=Dreissena polymorpha TaxID=45954 RepID=A0A9D4F539_DREPO|nr:hypothetical protein DPMN_144623 [Dreissena polymorpha]